MLRGRKRPHRNGVRHVSRCLADSFYLSFYKTIERSDAPKLASEGSCQRNVDQLGPLRSL